MRRLFQALEVSNGSNHVLAARSPTVLFTDADCFHETMSHLDIRRQEKGRVWDYQVVHYFPMSDEGFPKPAAGTRFDVFVVFLFGYNELQNRRECFSSFFTGIRTPMRPFYVAEDMEDGYPIWKRPGMPWLRITTPLAILRDHVKRQHGSCQCQRWT